MVSPFSWGQLQDCEAGCAPRGAQGCPSARLPLVGQGHSAVERVMHGSGLLTAPAHSLDISGGDEYDQGRERKCLTEIPFQGTSSHPLLCRSLPLSNTPYLSSPTQQSLCPHSHGVQSISSLLIHLSARRGDVHLSCYVSISPRTAQGLRVSALQVSLSGRWRAQLGKGKALPNAWLSLC